MTRINTNRLDEIGATEEQKQKQSKVKNVKNVHNQLKQKKKKKQKRSNCYSVAAVFSLIVMMLNVPFFFAY